MQGKIVATVEVLVMYNMLVTKWQKESIMVMVMHCSQFFEYWRGLSLAEQLSIMQVLIIAYN